MIENKSAAAPKGPQTCVILGRSRGSFFKASGRRAAAFTIGLIASASLSGGCGGFLVEGGIFPLPAIHLVYPYPIQIGIPFETVTLPTAGGLPIFGWWIPAQNARATVLIHHGAVVNRSSHLAHYALLHDLGCNVFIYDYQGFGESLVLATLGTILDDADAALAHVQSRTEPGTGSIILFGLSMGTMPALAQGSRSPERVVGLVLEGSFVQNDLPPFAFALLGIQPSPLAFERIPAELDPVHHAPLVAVPKYFMHSINDITTPMESSRRLFDLAAPPKQFIELIGGHIDAVNADPAYREHMERILNELVTASNPAGRTKFLGRSAPAKVVTGPR